MTDSPRHSRPFSSDTRTGIHNQTGIILSLDAEESLLERDTCICRSEKQSGSDLLGSYQNSAEIMERGTYVCIAENRPNTTVSQKRLYKVRARF